MTTNDETPSSQQEEKAPPPVSEIERKLMSAAEELGTWLGTAERKATEVFNQQRPAITSQLERIRDTAVRLLAQIEKGRERSR
jgi:hypothetical protein